MSGVTVYKIQADGEVVFFAEPRNSFAWSVHIWRTLDAKYGTDCDTAALEFGPLWALLGTTKLSERDSIVLGATCDGVWVKRENVPRLVEALRSFWAEYHLSPPSKWLPDETRCEITPTIPQVADACSRAIGSDETARGVCFRGTSVSESAWILYDVDESRPFNFDRDTSTAYGEEPWELFEAIDTRRAMEKVALVTAPKTSCPGCVAAAAAIKETDERLTAIGNRSTDLTEKALEMAKSLSFDRDYWKARALAAEARK